MNKNQLRKPFQMQTSTTWYLTLFFWDYWKKTQLKVITVLSFPSQLPTVMPSSIYLSHRNQFLLKITKNFYKNTLVSTEVVKFWGCQQTQRLTKLCPHWSLLAKQVGRQSSAPVPNITLQGKKILTNHKEKFQESFDLESSFCIQFWFM